MSRLHFLCRCNRAFTLIELILVMVILAIAAALVAPSLHAFGAGRTNSDMATTLVSLTQYARTQSVTEGRTYRLNFDVLRQQVWLTAESVDHDGTMQPAANDFGNMFAMSDGIQMRTDAPSHQDGQYIEFRATGRTDPAHIWLTDSMGRTIELACASATETFRILRPQEMTP